MNDCTKSEENHQINTELSDRPLKEPKTDESSNHVGEGRDTSTDDAAIKLTSKDYYFDSYAHYGIHEEMIKDDVRTQSYLGAIESNREQIEGKVVLDVGCGTGILSMFCARNGAAKVIGIECSAIAIQAQQIVRANGMSDVITIIHAKCEDVAELPDGIAEVDVVVSEWMGYFLLYESMLGTVLYCRDKWLKPGGLILPDRAALKIAAIEDEQYRKEKIDFWDDVYGFDMKVIKEIALTEPLIDTVDKTALISDSSTILDLDLNNCTKDDLSFTSTFRLTFAKTETVHALVSYFNCLFSHLAFPQFFSTGPSYAYTHWKQTIFYLSEPVEVEKGEVIIGSIAVKPNEGNDRDLDILLQLVFQGRKGDKRMKQSYRLR
mmetsp:Transcript_205/g.317  ORF Transcript_205/g.317 Transcript_205/m.317 type:complete len:377 (-) Transcript_205:214-1344(-)